MFVRLNEAGRKTTPPPRRRRPLLPYLRIRDDANDPCGTQLRKRKGLRTFKLKLDDMTSLELVKQRDLRSQRIEFARNREFHLEAEVTKNASASSIETRERQRPWRSAERRVHQSTNLKRSPPTRGRATVPLDVCRWKIPVRVDTWVWEIAAQRLARSSW
jgi:hypothetical protein